MNQRISLADVAREAQVSLMTVSRVVRDKDEVSPSTRERVLAAIEQLGYRPNALARGLVTQRSGTLGLVMPDVANPFFSEIALAVETAAYTEGYNVFLGNTGENPQREFDMLTSLQEKQVDGIVLCSSRMEESELRALVAQYSAVVLTNRRLEDAGVGSVIVDHLKGGYDATRHLIEGSHHAIGFLAGPSFSRGGQERAAGYRTALEEAGITYQSGWEIGCPPTVEGGYQAARNLLARRTELTALFCYNDLVAVGALRAISDMGRRVPDDIAIVGFDDIPLAAFVTPALTTCRVPRREMGNEVVRLLFNKLSNETDQTEVIVLESQLVVRQSTF